MDAAKPQGQVAGQQGNAFLAAMNKRAILDDGMLVNAFMATSPTTAKYASANTISG